MVKKGKTPEAQSRQALRSLSPWLLLAAGSIFVFLLRGLIANLPAEAAEAPYLDIWLRVWLFVVLGCGIACAYFLRDSDLRSDLFAILIGIWLAGIVLLVLKNTSYSLNGIGGDIGFQTAQVTKFATYSGSVDFAYKDLPAFYPPLYFFVLGKAAALLQIAPYKIMKYGLIAIVFLLPFLARRIWTLVVPGVPSLVLVFSFLFFQDFYKPAEWLALFLFVPWWIYFVEGVGTRQSQRRWQWFLGGSLLGAIIFTTYYYWFFIGAVSLAVSFVLQKLYSKDRSTSTGWTDKMKVLGGAAFFSLPYWGPYLLSMWVTGGWSPLQNRYFIPDFANLEFPFLEFSVTGLVLMVGLAYLLLSQREKPLSLALVKLLLGAYLWQLLGYVTLLLDAPLLTFKARDLVIYVLAIAALVGGYELWSWALRRRTDRSRWAGLLVGMAIVLPFYFGQKIERELVDSALLPAAKEETYPADLITDYQQALGSNNLDRVILGDKEVAELSIYLPTYQFVAWAAHFSHPAGLYYERIEFLQELSHTQNSAWFAAAVMNNRFSHIDELILFPKDNGYTFAYRPENFPYPVETEVVFFSETLFPGELFSSKPVAGFVLFRPVYANNPLINLPPSENVTSASSFGLIGDAEDMYLFLVDFGQYVQFENQDEYWRVLSALFS